MLSQYEILEMTVQYLTPRDLFHLAITSSQLYNLIIKSEPIFARLKRLALCDGYGLTMRQEFRGELYELREDWDFFWGQNGRKARYDEEVEVRVWNLKCDAANALPCLKCGFKVCEECRYVPRVRDAPRERSRRRPHLDPGLACHDIICYCAECDEQVERNLPLSISIYCNCDQYTRWICLPCRIQEVSTDRKYLDTRTEFGDSMSASELQKGRWIYSRTEILAYWCPCGKRSPSTGHVRCAWCKKKHDLVTWRDESNHDIPYFDEDPCHPRIEEDLTTDLTGERMMYSRLGYQGPIYGQSEHFSSI